MKKILTDKNQNWRIADELRVRTDTVAAINDLALQLEKVFYLIL